jgi:hypothetical protein
MVVGRSILPLRRVFTLTRRNTLVIDATRQREITATYRCESQRGPPDHTAPGGGGVVWRCLRVCRLRGTAGCSSAAVDHPRIAVALQVAEIRST